MKKIGIEAGYHGQDKVQRRVGRCDICIHTADVSRGNSQAYGREMSGEGVSTRMPSQTSVPN